ncbi:prephenate dehydratase [Emmonsiellopsis sp. PD_33]|nr:prephenate dehydratase [Emmonsiellopsis sp. PD_33]
MSSLTKLRVTFLGPLASFSHQAALELFSTSATLLPKPNFAEAFAAIQSNEADYAVIPFENVTNGSIVQTLDLLADRHARYQDIAVCGEHYLTVHHCLLVRKGEADAPDPATTFKRITKLYTHPQAWGQCETFLSAHFKGVERQDAPSTSKAASIVATNPNAGNGNGNGNSGGIAAAIASKFAADHVGGLDVLAANIEDRKDNTTRFLVLRNEKSGNPEIERPVAAAPSSSSSSSTTTTTTTPTTNTPPATTIPPTTSPSHPSKRKTLISFMINHTTPGALVDALEIFKKHGLNLTSINSRPGQVRAWQYVFFVECARIPGVHGDGTVERVMADLRAATVECRDLGSWRDQLGG